MRLRLQANENIYFSVMLITAILIVAILYFLSSHYQSVWYLFFVNLAIIFFILLDVIKSGQVRLFSLVFPLLFTAILLPPYRFSGNFPDLPWYIYLVYYAIVLILIQSVLSEKYTIKRLPAYKWFFLLIFFVGLSSAYASFFLRLPLQVRDYFEFLRIGSYIFIFMLIANQKLRQIDFNRTYKMILLIFFISACFGLAQYYNLWNINELLSPYYAPTQIYGLITHSRITGTTANPNEFGALMLLASSLAISGILFFQESKLRFICLALTGLFFVSIVLTLSRSSIVAFFIMVPVSLLLFLKHNKFKHRYGRVLLFIVILFLFSAFLLEFLPERVMLRFGQLADLSEATSWQGRLMLWETHYSYWLESPWFGWGPGKVALGTLVDNEWLLILRRYGIVGFTVFLCLFGSLFFGLSEIRNSNNNPKVLALTIAIQSSFIGLIFYMIAASIFHSLQLMPILLIITGLAYSQRRTDSVSFEE